MLATAQKNNQILNILVINDKVSNDLSLLSSQATWATKYIIP